MAPLVGGVYLLAKRLVTLQVDVTLPTNATPFSSFRDVPLFLFRKRVNNRFLPGRVLAYGYRGPGWLIFMAPAVWPGDSYWLGPGWKPS